ARGDRRRPEPGRSGGRRGLRAGAAPLPAAVWDLQRRGPGDRAAPLPAPAVDPLGPRLVVARDRGIDRIDGNGGAAAGRRDPAARRGPLQRAGLVAADDRRPAADPRDAGERRTGRRRRLIASAADRPAIATRP